MSASDRTKSQRLRLGALLWTGAVVGAVAVTVGVLPQLTAEIELPAPLWLIGIASFAQTSVLMGLAVWSGLKLAPPLGLRAPACEAAVTGGSVAPALRPQIPLGLVFGVLGGVFLFAGMRLSPAPIVAVQEKFNPPIVARILYGGISEEVLLRWGVMTALAWLAWRFVQGRRGDVKPGVIWVANLASAVLFGVGHLPAARVLIGSLDLNVVLFVIGFNATFGLVFGWLYWRRGLESAMVAHAMTHLVSYLITLAVGAFSIG